LKKTRIKKGDLVHIRDRRTKEEMTGNVIKVSTWESRITRTLVIEIDLGFKFTFIDYNNEVKKDG